MRLRGAARRERNARTTELLGVLGVAHCADRPALLGVLGVAHCADRRPDQLSGGEQQRTAIAAALANRPDLLLADEPTGELDNAIAVDVFGALQRANAELGTTVLVVTHDPAVSAQVRRTIAIADGRTSTETLRHAAGADGALSQHAVEYAVLDRAGRVQLPLEIIFQSFGLIPILSAAENAGVPLRIAGVPAREREERVALMLALVGLSGHAAQRPNELSGGQQQRVAIARALAGRPQLLIADEPTGQLDSQTGRQILRLLRTVVRSEGITALVATHDPVLIDLADTALRLDDGVLTQV